MSEPSPNELMRAIGDLGPARRHLQRLEEGILPVSPMLLREISGSLERCVARLTELAKAGHAAVDVQVDQVCHEEQLGVWADDMVAALAMAKFVRDDLSHDELLDLNRTVARELKRVVAIALAHPGRAARP